MTRVIIRSHVDISLSTQMRLTWMDEFGWVEVLWRPLEFGVPVVSRNACCYFKSVRDKMMDGWGPFWKYSFSVKHGLAEVGAPYGVDVAYEGGDVFVKLCKNTAQE